MAVNKAVHKLNVALSHMNKAAKGVKNAKAAEKKALTTEKGARAKLATQEKAIVDSFQAGTMTPEQSATAAKTLFTLGQKDQQAVDAYKKAITHDKAVLKKDQKAYKADKKTALKDLHAAELHLGLKQTNKDRKALGLKAVKHVIRPENKGSDALKAAKSVLGHNIQQLKYSGPLAKYLSKWPSSHVCCANFVSACLQKEGLIKGSEHSDNVRGLATNLSHDKNWKKVSSSHMSPGDVVCFNVPGEGSFAHVEMFVGYKNGKPQFIGSNNVNSDGSQRISEGGAGYHIDAVYHYKG